MSLSDWWNLTYEERDYLSRFSDPAARERVRERMLEEHARQRAKKEADRKWAAENPVTEQAISK